MGEDNSYEKPERGTHARAKRLLELILLHLLQFGHRVDPSRSLGCGWPLPSDSNSAPVLASIDDRHGFGVLW
jgi:hypothetical protein